MTLESAAAIWLIGAVVGFAGHLIVFPDDLDRSLLPIIVLYLAWPILMLAVPIVMIYERKT